MTDSSSSKKVPLQYCYQGENPAAMRDSILCGIEAAELFKDGSKAYTNRVFHVPIDMVNNNSCICDGFKDIDRAGTNTFCIVDNEKNPRFFDFNAMYDPSKAQLAVWVNKTMSELSPSKDEVYFNAYSFLTTLFIQGIYHMKDYLEITGVTKYCLLLQSRLNDFRKHSDDNNHRSLEFDNHIIIKPLKNKLGITHGFQVINIAIAFFSNTKEIVGIFKRDIDVGCDEKEVRYEVNFHAFMTDCFSEAYGSFFDFGQKIDTKKTLAKIKSSLSYELTLLIDKPHRVTKKTSDCGNLLNVRLQAAAKILDLEKPVVNADQTSDYDASIIPLITKLANPQLASKEKLTAVRALHQVFERHLVWEGQPREDTLFDALNIPDAVNNSDVKKFIANRNAMVCNLNTWIKNDDAFRDRFFKDLNQRFSVFILWAQVGVMSLEIKACNGFIREDEKGNRLFDVDLSDDDNKKALFKHMAQYWGYDGKGARHAYVHKLDWKKAYFMSQLFDKDCVKNDAACSQVKDEIISYQSFWRRLSHNLWVGLKGVLTYLFEPRQKENELTIQRPPKQVPLKRFNSDVGHSKRFTTRSGRSGRKHSHLMTPGNQGPVI